MNMDYGLFGAPFLGGILIGLAALLMLALNGRVMGVSGIIGGFFNSNTRKDLWRYLFLIGILTGGFFVRGLIPESLTNSLNPSTLQLMAAGLLVGWGTRLGSGCTSGHGICGVSRLSPRSLLATFTFMFFGFLTVWLMHFWRPHE